MVGIDSIDDRREDKYSIIIENHVFKLCLPTIFNSVVVGANQKVRCIDIGVSPVGSWCYCGWLTVKGAINYFDCV